VLCFTAFNKGMQLYRGIELSKPSFKSRKDERIAKSTFPQRHQVSFPAFFLTLHAERQRENL